MKRCNMDFDPTQSCHEEHLQFNFKVDPDSVQKYFSWQHLSSSALFSASMMKGIQLSEKLAQHVKIPNIAILIDVGNTDRLNHIKRDLEVSVTKLTFPIRNGISKN